VTSSIYLSIYLSTYLPTYMSVGFPVVRRLLVFVCHSCRFIASQDIKSHASYYSHRQSVIFLGL